MGFDLPFNFVDTLACFFFITCWLGYTAAVERTSAGQRSLNRLMDRHRYAWKRATILRENRVVDTTINASLQNGAAFFASTSLLAIGASLTLLRSTTDVLGVLAEMPFGIATTRAAWDMKVLGLTVVFVYAFFKFAWSYRLFNYAAILIGAVPNVKGGVITPEVELAAWRAGSMSTVGGRSFNRGQRAFFFALAYLGFFISGYVLIISTAFVLFVMWRRQFASDAVAALGTGRWPEMP